MPIFLPFGQEASLALKNSVNLSLSDNPCLVKLQHHTASICYSITPASCCSVRFAAFRYFRIIFPTCVFMLLFPALTAWVVYRGVEKGIEKFSRFIMPGLILFLVSTGIV